MKKCLSVLMSIILLFSAYIIPSSATESEVNYGSYYKFDFSKNVIFTDYTVNTRKGYKSVSYIPLASDSSTEVTHATINGNDALRVKTSGMTTLVPLKSDGTPFVMETGKSYTVNFTMVVKRSSARWSRCLFTPYSDINGVKASATNSENVISYVKDDTSAKAYGQRSLYGPGTSSNQWMYFDWVYNNSHTKLPAFKKSGSTFTADVGQNTYEHTTGYTINFNKTLTIKSNEEMERLGVTVNSDGTYERNGVTYNNFFAIEFSGSSTFYTPGENEDAMVTATDSNGNPYYQLFSDYYITNLEIISDDYVATTTLYNSEEKLTTVILQNGYIKNIAGQLNNRGMLVLSKLAAVAVQVLIIFAVFIFSAAVMGKICWGDKLVFESVSDFAKVFGIHYLLHFSFASLVTALTILVRGSGLGMTFGILCSTGITSLLYAFADILAV